MNYLPLYLIDYVAYPALQQVKIRSVSFLFESVNLNAIAKYF